MFSSIKKYNPLQIIPIPLRSRVCTIKDTDSKIKKIVFYIIQGIQYIFHLYKLTASKRYRQHCLRVLRNEFKFQERNNKTKIIDELTKPLNSHTIENPSNALDPQKIKSNAAITIQKIVRGYLIRKKIKEYKAFVAQLNQLDISFNQLENDYLKNQQRLSELEKNRKSLQTDVSQAENKLLQLKTRIGNENTNIVLLTNFLSLTRGLESYGKETTIEKEVMSLFDPKKKEIFKIHENKLSTYRKKLSEIENDVVKILDNKILNVPKIKSKLKCLTESADHNSRYLTLYEEEHQSHQKKLDDVVNELQLITEEISSLQLKIKEIKREKKSLNHTLEKKWMEISQQSVLPTKQVTEPTIKVTKIEEHNDLKAPYIEKIPPTVSETLGPDKEALDTISKYIHADMGKLFKLLFMKFPPNSFKSWICDTKGNFKLTLNQKVHIWIPCNNSIVKGGVIMKLGNDYNVIEGKMDKTSGTIHFENGFNNLCLAKVGFFTKEVESKMVKMTYKSKESIDFSVKYLSTETSKENFTGLEQQWGHLSQLVEQNPWSYLKSK